MFLNSPKRFPNRKQIEAQFDRAAATYDSVAKLQRQMGNALLQRILDQELPTTARLLDLGCGTGELLVDLRRHGYESLCGLDLSSNMIQIAQAKSPTVSFLKAPLEAIPVDEKEFDVVISNAAIQWCDTEITAAEIDRVLKPGGSLFLNAFVQGTLGQWGTAFEKCGLQSRVQPLPCGEDVEAMFAGGRFEELQVQQCTETSSFGSIDEMFSSIRKLGATNAAASRRQPVSKTDYLALKRYFQQQLDLNGKLELDFVWIEVCAKKMA